MDLNQTEILQTLVCESGLKYNAKGDWNGRIFLAYGVAQFHKGTWDYFNTLRAKQGLGQLTDYKSTKQQLQMIAWAFDNKLKSHWSCYNNLYKKYQ